MELLLKRYFWTLPIVMIVACAFLAALGANHVVEAKYLLGADVPKAATAHRVRPHKEGKPPPSKDAQVVIARNIFCSTCEPPKDEEAPAASGPVDANHPPLTSLPLALLATIVAEDPGASAATIVNTQSFRSGSYAVGDVIPDAGDVRRIHPKSVDFWNQSSKRLERIDLVAPHGGPGVAQAGPPPPGPMRPEPPPGEIDYSKGVRKVDETHYEIDRSMVDKILADPTAAARSARIVPSIRDGKSNGFKLYAIRPNSMFSLIGLQNGDTIQAINGFDMSSPDKALEVYTKVRSASSLSVSVLRRGQQLNLEYSIR